MEPVVISLNGTFSKVKIHWETPLGTNWVPLVSSTIRLVLNKVVVTTGEGDEGSSNIEYYDPETDAQHWWHDIQDQIGRIRQDVVKCDIIQRQGNNSSYPNA